VKITPNNSGNKPPGAKPINTTTDVILGVVLCYPKYAFFNPKIFPKKGYF